MEIIDYVLIVTAMLSTLIGLSRGFVKESVSLLTWVVAFWCAWKFGGALAGGLPASIESADARLWLARGILLLSVLVIGGLLNWLITFLLSRSGLTGTDRAMGMLFGFARGVLLAGVLVAVLDMLGFDETGWWGQSKLIPYAAPVADILRDVAEDGADLLTSNELAVEDVL